MTLILAITALIISIVVMIRADKKSLRNFVAYMFFYVSAVVVAVQGLVLFLQYAIP